MNRLADKWPYLPQVLALIGIVWKIIDISDGQRPSKDNLIFWLLLMAFWVVMYAISTWRLRDQARRITELLAVINGYVALNEQRRRAWFS